MASEIKALHAARVGRAPNDAIWASYLALGLSEHTEETFWQGIRSLPPGHALAWHDGELRVRRWYDLAERATAEYDRRPLATATEEYRALLRESVRLRFRSDVPVGIALSGGLDSSVLLGLVQLEHPETPAVRAFSYVTGDPRYDELPWIEAMLAQTRHPSVVSRLTPDAVPRLAEAVQGLADEPMGGLPTLGYARLFEHARQAGVKVVLDGQGMDEQWAGYDYYRAAPAAPHATALVQGTRQPATRADALVPEFRARAVPLAPARPFRDRLRSLQYRDVRYTKMPRALRFNDRVSMRASVELREPFLDHRLFELALRQPRRRKLTRTTGKWMLRRIARDWLPIRVVEAPKRPLSTPQREWLRGPLKPWATDCIEQALSTYGGAWLEPARVRQAWHAYCAGAGDNSVFVWQWVSLGLAAADPRAPRAASRVDLGVGAVSAHS